MSDITPIQGLPGPPSQEKGSTEPVNPEEFKHAMKKVKETDPDSKKKRKQRGEEEEEPEETGQTAEPTSAAGTTTSPFDIQSTSGKKFAIGATESSGASSTTTPAPNTDLGEESGFGEDEYDYSEAFPTTTAPTPSATAQPPPTMAPTEPETLIPPTDSSTESSLQQEPQAASPPRPTPTPSPQPNQPSVVSIPGEEVPAKKTTAMPSADTALSKEAGKEGPKTPSLAPPAEESTHTPPLIQQPPLRPEEAEQQKAGSFTSFAQPASTEKKPIKPEVDVTAETPPLEGMGPAPITSGGSEMNQDKKEEDKAAAAAATPDVTPQPLPFDAMAAPSAPLPSYASLPQQVYDLFEKLSGVMTVMQETGVKTTEITLTTPGLLSGTTISIKEYSTAPMQYNIEVLGASQEAASLFSTNTNDLLAAFQAGNYNFRVNRLDTGMLSSEKSSVRRVESISDNDADKGAM